MTKKHGRWPAKKRLLIKRDGRHCWLCGKFLFWSQMTFDHYIPRSLGGDHHTDNLRLACKECNDKRGNQLPPGLAGTYDWR